MSPVDPAGAPVVVRTYLEMRDPAMLRAPTPDSADTTVERVDPCTPAAYRALYSAVGAAYQWTDRDAWSDQTLADYLDRADVAVWRLTVGGELAGYFELAGHEADGSVELVYFGLLAPFHGRGLGGRLLAEAVREAWRRSPSRLWLHTCTLDSPAALPNYLARGFTAYAEERYPRP